MPSLRQSRSEEGAEGLTDTSADERHRPSRGLQTRTKSKRSDIESAALSALAEDGTSKLTHRLISRAAGVSIAATTYHYADKHDIIVSASARLMRKFEAYLAGPSVGGLSSRLQAVNPAPAISSLLLDFAKEDYFHFNGWAELMLYSARRQDDRRIGQTWYETFDRLGNELSRHGARIQGLTDLLVGLLLAATSQGLTAGQLHQVLRDGADPLTAWKPQTLEPADGASLARATRKSAETRAKVLAAAIDLLAEDGPGAVTYRAVARKAGVAQGTPFYQFRTISVLLSEAQGRLFEESKHRYRTAAERFALLEPTIEHLIDQTSSVFWREVTEHAGKSASSYSLWVEGARDKGVRLMIWKAIEDQLIAWQRVLKRLNPEIRPIDPLLAQALFVGKLIRIIAVGPTASGEDQIREEFDRDLRAIANARFWL